MGSYYLITYVTEDVIFKSAVTDLHPAVWLLSFRRRGRKDIHIINAIEIDHMDLATELQSHNPDPRKGTP